MKAFKRVEATHKWLLIFNMIYGGYVQYALSSHVLILFPMSAAIWFCKQIGLYFNSRDSKVHCICSVNVRIFQFSALPQHGKVATDVSIMAFTFIII